MTTDDNQPLCQQHMTVNDLRSDLDHRSRSDLSAITQVRHGQIAVYPQDRMQRLLKPGEAIPRWRRLLRRLHLLKG